MKGEKKNLPMKSIDKKGLQNIEYDIGKSGEFRAFAFMDYIAQIQMAQILKELHDDKNYKKFGYGTFDEVCEKKKVGKTQAYRLMDILKIAGPNGMARMYSAGLSTRAQYLLLKGSSEIEDAEFEVLSDDEIKINGRKVSIKDNPEKVLERLLGLKHERDTERRARKDLERELEETKRDLKDKKRTIQVGEEEDAKLREQLKHREKGLSQESVTPIGRMIVEIVYLATSIEQEEVHEDDKPHIEHWLKLLDFGIFQRILDKLKPFLPTDEDAI